MPTTTPILSLIKPATGDTPSELRLAINNNADTLDNAVLTGDSRLLSAALQAALAGTAGTPGSGNKFVTDSDARMTNARTPTTHSHTFWETKGFTVGGAVAVASGSSDVAYYIPPVRVRLRAGQTAKLARVEYKIGSGTSATFKLQINGADATGFTGLAAGTSWGTTDPADIVLADGDEIAVVVTAVSSSPTNLSVGVVLEHTVTT